MRSRALFAVLITLLGALVLLLPRVASAHQVGLSRGEYKIDGATITAELVFARREVLSLVRSMDENGDGAISPTEIQHAREALGRAVVDRVSVRAGEGVCPGTLDDAFLVEEDGFSVRIVYRCPASPRAVRVRLDVLDDLPYGHRHIARADVGTGPTEHVLFGANREIGIAGLPGGGEAPAAPKAKHESEGFFGFFRMGIEHILFGYDHLVFLFGLVLVGGRLRALLLVVTAFTVAHSITLGLAVLGIWAPSGRIVEPIIALSVAYVGVENQFVKDAENRFRITFPFGLVHGFGFAGALGEIALPRPQIPGALLAFNLGVEAGQLAVLAVVLPLLVTAQKRKWLEKRGVKILSLGIAALGLVWFVLRIVDADG
ncbi:HupE/UreJ family protein [Polyangium jinanense]|uniref:HupE/UreJ family protein n=1 Tax=Polyangium jinanense TaxID=2829994 RepID=A0A9X3WYS2_9BACT|nr:HupE/UreJ family protein [Polyangium jinanense]MDC3953796.1 HupE/UreJ family protein [Polyangium jinanense]MDC3979083.1 HupE/UreJ family protein [Polyangium jinanense]